MAWVMPRNNRRESPAKRHQDNKLEKSTETEGAVEHRLADPPRQNHRTPNTDTGMQLMKEVLGVNTSTRNSKWKSAHNNMNVGQKQIK